MVNDNWIEIYVEEIILWKKIDVEKYLRDVLELDVEVVMDVKERYVGLKRGIFIEGLYEVYLSFLSSFFIFMFRMIFS